MTPEQWHRTWVAPAEARKAVTAEKRAKRKRQQAEEKAARKAKWEADMAYWAATKEERMAAELEKLRLRMAKFRKDSPEIVRQRGREYYNRHKDCPEWRAKQKAAKQRYQAKIRELNAPAIAARKEKRLAKEEAKRLRMQSRAEKAEARRLELLANPKKKRVFLTDDERAARKKADKKNGKHRRRARLAGLVAKATSAEVRELKKSAKGRCFYCCAKVKMLTLDHIVPIAKGGGHSLDNIVFACHACNSEKRDLPPNEYAQKHGLLLV